APRAAAGRPPARRRTGRPVRPGVRARERGGRAWTHAAGAAARRAGDRAVFDRALVLLSGADRRAGGSSLTGMREHGDAMRVLVCAATTGYQVRAFDEAAGALGIELQLATDRCHVLDD